MLRLSLLCGLLLCLLACQPERTISFNDDVRPILNEKCIGCHGGVKQAGGVGFVFRENALREADSGSFAIVPGKPAQSEIIRRVRHENEDLRMPFEAAPLSDEEIGILETWIEEGAHWEEHWAYQPPVRPEIPEGDGLAGLDGLDALIRSSLREQSIAPAPRAKDRVLLRRVAFDLTGLPPTETLSAAYLDGRITYEALVDSLLASPAYGEHRAAKWLELARYADSRGYEKDTPREIYQYRDWVIRAFNDDMPYDHFIVEQLAGDLLPDATDEQLIATGFHRNTMSNDEGGTSNEEYRVAAVIDRVNTTWEVFQGTTMACVQCHSHPYDPIVHAEFYTSYALFNNTTDHDHATDAPLLRTLYHDDAAKLRKLTDYLTDEGFARAQVQKWERMIKVREPRMRPMAFEHRVGGRFTDRGDEDVLYLKPGESFALPVTDLTDVGAIHLSHRAAEPGTLDIRLDAIDGPLVGQYESTGGWGIHDARIPLQATAGEHQLFFSVTGKGEGTVVAVNTLGFEPRLPGDDPEKLAEIAGFVTELLTARDSVSTPVLIETSGPTERSSHVFERGNWLVHGKEVTSGVPELLDGKAAATIDNRLDFARWLTNPDQPLTARVAVNRTWGQLFGHALVPTVEDLGSQGDKPRYQNVLDLLAVDFATGMDWSFKQLLRRIVLSETYRQSSEASPDELGRDPHNDLLARGPRKRLTAEEIRDQNLAVSGLLSRKLLGPSVMPDQPDGLWDNIPYSGVQWKTSAGEDRYRRTVYTFLRRSVVHPALTTFDASNRELCLSRRTITNTPLQALMALNDPEYLAVARELAGQIRDAEGLDEQLDELYDRLLHRSPTPDEMRVLRGLYADALTDSATADDALVVVVNALLNIDEYLSLA